jgi:hypothetical protein
MTGVVAAEPDVVVDEVTKFEEDEPCEPERARLRRRLAAVRSQVAELTLADEVL